MKNMFKVDYQGATLIEKNFIKQMLRMASGDVLECVQEECCIVFSLKGRDHILEHLDAKTLKNSLIEVRECSRQEFAAEEIQEFFDRMEKAQERMKKVLRGIAG